ncbi:DUF1641 domain-containing protein [Sediminibacillus massiliensis]|uniref:DUF1641 domain-containing protein n=1 Tax=Sediminibacillus massiliensis TaxID=1926277 RepID=UPI00098882C1|nr:DUF1641 domain-containing protein [Sediminibacillus massiliensis]
MAEPIKQIKRIELSEEEIREQELRELEDTLLNNKDAIMESMNIIHNMHEKGVLNLLSGLFGQGDKVLNTLVQSADKPEATNTIKNLLLLLGTAGLIDVKQLEPLLLRFGAGIERVAEEEDKDSKTGILDLFRAMKDPEINRSLTILMTFLKGMGQDSENLQKDMQPEEEQKEPGKTRN